jgi:hypothetical protein
MISGLARNCEFTERNEICSRVDWKIPVNHLRSGLQMQSSSSVERGYLTYRVLYDQSGYLIYGK